MLKTLRKAILSATAALMASIVVLAQGPQTVRGTVTDPSGETVVGGSVFVKGTQTGTVTDIDGTYVLNGVRPGNVLVFSCIGYVTQEITWNSGPLNVVLQNDTQMLEETVVVGYGVQKKVNLTGAVSQVKGDDFAQRPVVDAAQALQGMVPGLTISNTAAGTPGSATTITLRGRGNLSDTGNPYILVDGVEMSLQDVNPNDIESISVLKDAASAAIYGARAAYGVILVTTKRGADGKPVISYSGNVGWNAPTKLPTMASSVDFAHFWNDGAANANAPRKYSDEKIADLQRFIDGDPSADPWAEIRNNPTANPSSFENSEKGLGNTDYFKLHYKDWALKHNHNLSIRGGSKKVQYYVSGGMYDEDGALRFADMGYKRFNVNANTQAQVTDWLKLMFSTKFVHGQTDSPFGDGAIGYGFYHTMAREFSTKHYIDDNGHYVEYTMIPYLQSGTYTTTKRDRLDITPGLQIQPVKNWFINLDYTYRLGVNNYEAVAIAPDIYMMDGVTTVKGGRSELGIPKDGKYTRSNTNTNYQSISLYTHYSFTLGEKSNFALLAGYQEEDYHYAYIKNAITGLYTTATPSVTMGNGDQTITDTRYGWATRGYFGRINYDYDGRYLLELNGRYDGSSRFAADHRWGFFPSVSAGWNIHKEPFLQSASGWLSNLKLRASYGLLGNQAGAATYTFASTMSMSSGLGSYIYSDGRHSYTQAPGVVNPLTTWEKVLNQNVGLDFGFFGNALTGSFDLFQRDTRDMLGPGEDYPDIFGASAPQTNNANMRNRGWEFAINYRGHAGRDFNYSIGGSVSDATAVVTKYSNPTGTDPAGSWYEGKSVGEIWGYRADGLIQNQAEADAFNALDHSFISATNWTPGDVKYIDLNGDGKINKGSNTLDDMGDFTIIGNTTPRYNYTVNGSVWWKGIGLNFLFQGVGKRDYDPSSSLYFWGFGPYAQVTVLKEHMDYWREDNPNAYYPKPYIHNAGGVGTYQSKQKQCSDRYLQNAAYLRLKTVTLSYDLPQSLIGKIGLSKAQLYVTGENLLTFTKLSTIFDPEAIFTYNSYNGGNANRGASDAGKSYPMNKTVSVGIVVNF